MSAEAFARFCAESVPRVTVPIDAPTDRGGRNPMSDRGSRKTHSRSRSPTTRDDEEEFLGDATGSAANAASDHDDTFHHGSDRYVVDDGDEHERNDVNWY